MAASASAGPELFLRLASAACIVAIGYAAKSFGLVTQAEGQAVLRVIFNITLPSVLFLSFCTLDAASSAVTRVATIAVAHGVCMTAAGILTFRNRPPKARCNAPNIPTSTIPTPIP